MNNLKDSMLSLNDMTIYSFDYQGNHLLINDTDATIWIATANFLRKDRASSSTAISTTCNNSEKVNHTLLQKKAVRQLLNVLLEKLYEKNASFDHFFKNGIKLSLNESKYPYRLHPLDWYVNFSHSGDTVACAISKHHPIGIDCEHNHINDKIVKRYYHDDELRWLQNFDNDKKPTTQTITYKSTKHQYIDVDFAKKLLWMIKEATLKKQNATSLASILKLNHLQIAKKLLTDSNNPIKCYDNQRFPIKPIVYKTSNSFSNNGNEHTIDENTVNKNTVNEKAACDKNHLHSDLWILLPNIPAIITV